MTKSSSGGNRLKCSSGSESKDCNARSQITNQTQTKTLNSQNNDELGQTKKPNAADANPITLFGFNFDKDTQPALSDLKERFECHIGRNNYCAKSGILFYFKKDAKGDLTSITFECELFNGCTYSAEEIYQALSDSSELVGNVTSESNYLCDRGVAREIVCINSSSKSIRLTKDKFRQKSISFD